MGAKGSAEKPAEEPSKDRFHIPTEESDNEFDVKSFEYDIFTNEERSIRPVSGWKNGQRFLKN